MYHLWQCSNDLCRFRFPAADDAPRKESCIYCGALTYRVETTPRHPSPPRPTAVVPHLELLLDNIRSLYNVGGIFRTADGAGVRHLHLGGITATPDHPKMDKTALGAQSTLPWSHSLNSVDVARAHKQKGYLVWALEETPTAEPLFATRADPAGPPILLVLGNEVMGVDPAIVALCDKVLYIPMLGGKESLNVTIALGTAVYHLLHVR